MVAIADYGFLSDCQTGALVSKDGSVDWLCIPRFDAPSVFGRLLDPDAGHWSLAPRALLAGDGCRSTRSYEDDSLVLHTQFTTAEGAVEVVDALAFEPGARGHQIGLASPHVLLREVRGLRGRVEMASHLAPRFEYGLTQPIIERRDDAVLRAQGGKDTLLVTADVPLDVRDRHIASSFAVGPGDRVRFSLRHTPTFPVPDGRGRGNAPGPGDRATIDDTVTAWRSWAAQHWGDGQGYQGDFLAPVRRSALVLQGLTYQPSGAVVAALTTSLPEDPGGEGNWDYRYAWLRDASLLMHALWVAACPDEPEAFFHWINTAGGRNDSSAVQIMYGVEGERELNEHVLDHLRGYADSRPVRIGNAAWRQKQLDVLGEVLDVAHLMDENVDEWSDTAAELLTSFADRALTMWREPDAGMWEARDKERHYTSSKVLCWVALDRALALASRLRVDERREERWRRERDRIKRTIVTEAWVEEKEAFAGALGSDHLDASVLLMPLVGFLPVDDRRMRSTIETLDRSMEDGGLNEGGLIRRWAGETNAFVPTSYWMVRCLALLGRRDEAVRRFERVTACANDLGILAEEVDPKTDAAWGNTPQAFSHVGLINAAWELVETADERGPHVGEAAHAEEDAGEEDMAGRGSGQGA